MIYRLAQLKDIHEIASVHRNYLKNGYRLMLVLYYCMIISLPSNIVVVMEDADRNICGFACAVNLRRSILINLFKIFNIAVLVKLPINMPQYLLRPIVLAPICRGKGYASVLLDYFEIYLTRQNIYNYWVIVHKTNISSYRLFRNRAVIQMLENGDNFVFIIQCMKKELMI